LAGQGQQVSQLTTPLSRVAVVLAAAATLEVVGVEVKFSNQLLTLHLELPTQLLLAAVDLETRAEAPVPLFLSRRHLAVAERATLMEVKVAVETTELEALVLLVVVVEETLQTVAEQTA
jgi:hypothetical protein